jgi:hypothetical protein
MKLTTLLGLALWLPFVVRGGAAEAIDASSAAANSPAIPDGWLQLPSRELVLDIRHKSFESGARRDSCEFLAGIINMLVAANYTVRLSDDFVQDEIKYYRDNLDKGRPDEISKGILTCLEQARASGVLNWDCFKTDSKQGGKSITVERHLPWVAPPFKANAIGLAGADGTNLACLHLSLEWTGLNCNGAVQYARRPGALTGETVLIQGSDKMWAFAAVMRLTAGNEAMFEKVYPREEWQHSYSSIYEQPLWKTSQAIFQDLASGLRPKPVSRSDSDAKKSRKRSQSKSVRNASP